MKNKVIYQEYIKKKKRFKRCPLTLEGMVDGEKCWCFSSVTPMAVLFSPASFPTL